mmetsp:Transcript_1775/g.4092  ORF Transcript_1775/g.4092 Transcript_1775/m.4092 type:complete len:369 (-) Transcript_1775:104-1210(-)
MASVSARLTNQPWLSLWPSSCRVAIASPTSPDSKYSSSRLDAASRNAMKDSSPLPPLKPASALTLPCPLRLSEEIGFTSRSALSACWDTWSNLSAAWGMSSSRSGSRCLTRWKPVAIWWSEMRPEDEKPCSSFSSEGWTLGSSSIITMACFTHSWWKKGTLRAPRQWAASSSSWLAMYSLRRPCMLAFVASTSRPAPAPQHRSRRSAACRELTWPSTHVSTRSVVSAPPRSPPDEAPCVRAFSFCAKLRGRMSSITARAMKSPIMSTACGWSSKMSSALSSTSSNPRTNWSVESVFGYKEEKSCETISRSRWLRPRPSSTARLTTRWWRSGWPKSSIEYLKSTMSPLSKNSLRFSATRALKAASPPSK